MKFPQDLLCFLYWVFFKPASLRDMISAVDPSIGNAATLLTRRHSRQAVPLRNLALFYIVAAPWLLGVGTALILSGLGLHVNWLELVLYLLVAMVLGASFSLAFCIAFLLPFSVMIAIWSSISLTPALGALLSLLLGLAYGLNGNSDRWGLIAGLAYGVVIGFLVGPLEGLAIGAAFLIGYFRIVFYLIEALLAWLLGALAPRGEARSLWRFQPICWDELIWLPLPGLDRHLRALKQQDAAAFQEALHTVQGSFRQKRAAQGEGSSKR